MTFILLIIFILNLFEAVTCYNDAEYVSKIVYNPGSCTMNDYANMLSTLMLMWKDFNKYIEKEKLTERIAHKFKILNIRRPRIVHKETIPNKMPLVQKGFKINGYNVLENEPVKLHNCFFCECEAVYRQVQSKVDYDDTIMEDFQKFAHNKIDKLLDYALSDLNQFDLDSYFQKLGIKRHEFEQGYLDYQTYKKVILAYKMHVKIDEKIYINYNKYKMKARNISAQNKRVKLLMGIICEVIMTILHNQEWSGPGSTNYEKCKIFEKWIQEIGGDCGVLCADGSAFDSTQHYKIQEIVDNYMFDKVINRLNFLYEYGDKQDYKKICLQQDFVIFSKYFTYKCKGTQMTGRMNTCLGNTVRSWLYVEFIKYKIHQTYPHVDINYIHEMVNGDDQIIFMRRHIFKIYEEIAYKFVYSLEDKSIKHGLGQIAKIFDKYPEINGAEFLSCILLYDPISGKCLMVRKLERFLQLTPFTYNNKFVNITKFRLLNAELLIADSKNILSDGNNLTMYKKYAQKMFEIGMKEKQKIYKTKFISTKTKEKLKKIFKDPSLQFKTYIQDVHNDRNNEKDDFIFDQLYYKFLEKTYNVKNEDIEELFMTIQKLNVNNYLEKYNCHIVDKLMNVKSIKQFLDVKKKIDQTKVHVEINLQGSKMLINQFSRD